MIKKGKNKNTMHQTFTGDLRYFLVLQIFAKKLTKFLRCLMVLSCCASKESTKIQYR